MKLMNTIVEFTRSNVRNEGEFEKCTEDKYQAHTNPYVDCLNHINHRLYSLIRVYAHGREPETNVHIRG